MRSSQLFTFARESGADGIFSFVLQDAALGSAGGERGSRNGPLPFDVLEAQVNDWIAARRRNF